MVLFHCGNFFSFLFFYFTASSCSFLFPHVLMSFCPSRINCILEPVPSVLTVSMFSNMHVSLPGSPPSQSCFIYLSSLKLYILVQRYNPFISAVVAKAPQHFSPLIHHFSPHHSHSCSVCSLASMSVY